MSGAEPTVSLQDCPATVACESDLRAISPGGAASSAAAAASRYETLVRVSEALRACQDTDELFRSLARELHRVVAFSFLGLALCHDDVRAVDDALNHGALQRALALERKRARNREASDELLRALSSVLDIREIFPKISEIASTVLAHDRLTLTFHEEDGHFVVQAASDDATFVGERLTMADPALLKDGTFTIVDDADVPEAFPSVEPADFWTRTRSGGYRSVLCVRMRAGEQRFGVQFWAKSRGAFDRSHVPIARRIADHVALAISHERLAETVSQAAEARLRAEHLEARVRSLSDELATKAGYGRATGRSAAWRDVLKSATQVASTETTVLLVGESGTGKEVLARFVHRASTRHAGSFVAINCAALPEQLLEAELFGYERGAFTGAVQAKPGQIELAAGGVLFLDEVSEMSPSAQAKFVRVLQEREFQRLGATRTIQPNVRIVAATNRDLKKAMERGDFREDLYYRLRVFDIRLPPLRDRADDILPLSEAFLHLLRLAVMYACPW